MRHHETDQRTIGHVLADKAAALVARLAGQSRAALRRMKELYRMAGTSRPDVALATERETLLRHLAADPGVAEGLAAFAEHRDPDFARFTGEPS